MPKFIYTQVMLVEADDKGQAMSHVVKHELGRDSGHHCEMLEMSLAEVQCEIPITPPLIIIDDTGNSKMVYERN